MSSSKHFTRNGPFWQVFIRVYRLEIQSVMLVFSTQLCELLPISNSLWFNSPPLPCGNKYTVYTYGVGGGVMGFCLTENTFRKVPLQFNFLR